MHALPLDALVASLAGRTGLSEAQVRSLLQTQAELAYEHARNRVAFAIPGVGVLHVSDLAARETDFRFGPHAGKWIQLPAKSLVKFRVLELAKDLIVGGLTGTPDVFASEPYVASDGPSDD